MAGFAGALLAVLVGFILHAFTVGTGLINLSYDLLTVAKPVVVPTDAALVFMDEASHEKFGQPLNAPWDRAIHAQLVDRLTAAGAKAIVFDIVFSDPGRDPGADRKLTSAFAASKRVVLAADHEPLGGGMKKFRLPIEPLREAAAKIGSAEVIPGRDLIVRQHTPGPPHEPISSLAWSAAELIGAVRLDSAGAEPFPRWLHYYAPARSLPAVSYQDALNDNVQVDFAGKVVFVGARILTRFAGERKDEYRTPYSFWTSTDQFIAGVEIQATAFLNLVRGDWWRRLPSTAEAWTIVLLGAAIGWFVMQARSSAALLVAALAMLAVIVSSIAAARFGRVWFPWLVPIVQIGIVLLVSIVVNSFRLYLERRLYQQTLALYLSPKLVKKFAQDERFRQPGAEKQMLTILFSDIANFTSISEGMDSDELAKLMNKYFQTAVTDCIHKTDGTVVKYIGDAIFAFWNAPDLQTDHAVRACEAALRFRDQRVHYAKGQPLVTRIGLHTGVANVGNFGSAERVDYTALGESINLASRMEGLNKYLGTTVLLTSATQAEVDGHFATRSLGRFRLKGFEKSVEVFELLARKGAPVEAWQAHFSSALAAFVRREWEVAEREFRKVIELRKEDGPSNFYLRRMEEMRGEETGDWTGEIELKEK